MNSRLRNLDYLRGIAAFSIMIYHYSFELHGNFDASTIMGRIGIYGVSVFYVLSGLTLYHVYQKKMVSTYDVGDFFKKRIFRIFPLLWLATLAYVVLARELPNFQMLVLNLTGFFGFVSWDKYYATGAWSIGNELVFYIFLPAFVILSRWMKPMFIGLAVLISLLYVYFSFIVISGETLAAQWHNYTNPFNQVFLFLGGFLIGLIFQNTRMPNTVALALLTIGAGIFILTPAKGDLINIVTGYKRIAFTASCLLICLSFYKLGTLPKFMDRPLSILGEASYSVYLLHPLVYIAVAMILGKFMSKLALIAISVPVTIAASYLVYQYFEKYFIRLGKRSQQGSQNPYSQPI